MIPMYRQKQIAINSDTMQHKQGKNDGHANVVNIIAMHIFLQHLCIQFYFLSKRQETAEVYV